MKEIFPLMNFLAHDIKTFIFDMKFNNIERETIKEFDSIIVGGVVWTVKTLNYNIDGYVVITVFE